MEVLILDGAAIVNMLKPVNSKIYQDYTNNVLLPYIQSQLPTEMAVLGQQSSLEPSSDQPGRLPFSAE